MPNVKVVAIADRMPKKTEAVAKQYDILFGLLISALTG